MSRDMRVRIAGSNKLGISAECEVTHKRFEVVVNHGAWQRWHEGLRIQDAFPELTPQQREFLKNGVTPAEWEAMLGQDGD